MLQPRLAHASHVLRSEHPLNDGQIRAVLAAVQAIEASNNGYADIGTDAQVASAVQARGFTVIRATNLHGLPVYRGFTARAQAALRAEPFGFSTYKHMPQLLDEAPDFEAAILARQDRLIGEC